MNELTGLILPTIDGQISKGCEIRIIATIPFLNWGQWRLWETIAAPPPLKVLL